MPKINKSNQNKNKQVKIKKPIKKVQNSKRSNKLINDSMSIVFIFDCIQQSSHFRTLLIETTKQLTRKVEKDYKQMKIDFGYVQCRHYTNTGQCSSMQKTLSFNDVEFIEYLESISKFDKERHFETNVISALENASNILLKQQYVKSNKKFIIHFVNCLTHQEGNEFDLVRINKVIQKINDYKVNYKIITTQDCKQGQKVREHLQDVIENYEEILFESKDDIPKLVNDSLLK